VPTESVRWLGDAAPESSRPKVAIGRKVSVKLALAVRAHAGAAHCGSKRAPAAFAVCAFVRNGAAIGGGNRECDVPERSSIEQALGRFCVATRGPGFIDVTREACAWLGSIGARDGLMTLFVQHTSASITIQENTDPDVLRDLADALARLAPRDGHYRHRAEGADDMPSHIKAMLTAASLSVPVRGGEPVLGTWQAIYLIEHRDRPHTREIVLHFVGTCGR
jgi:secondary thiamine-phosphate synthase enzyme